MRGRWRRDETGALPINLDLASSDEYDPLPLSPLVREARRRAWDMATENARRVGMSRRDFLRTSMGAATVLLALNACSKEEAKQRSTSTTRGTEPGSTFTVPTTAGTDKDAAAEVLDVDLPVIDAQTHFLEYDLASKPPKTSFGDGFPQAKCGEKDKRACFTVDDAVFRQSETAAAVLSAIPAPDPHSGELRIEVMDRARQRVKEAVGDGRLMIHGLVQPTGRALSVVHDDLEAVARSFKVDGWKAYTHTGRWRLDDGSLDAPQVGLATIQKLIDLGIPRFAIHKGISGNDPWASPEDVGPVAKQFPDARFSIYHSGWEPGVKEEAFSAATANKGVNRLIASLQKAGIGPNQNVYAELGSTWFNLMRSPDEAAHVIGKLLVALGEDRVLWGTDSIWYSSPQGQIDAFRTLSISPEFQERFGYPALTDKIKGKILARNAAELYGLDLAKIPRRARPA